MINNLYYDKDGSLNYKTQYNNYSLLLGKTSNNLNSDVLFIFREPTIKDINKGFTGEVVGFCYGGSYILKNKDFKIINEIISEYENKKYN